MLRHCLYGSLGDNILETSSRSLMFFRKCLKGAAILMPILGLPWMLGLIPEAATHAGMLYAFTVLNSTQVSSVNWIS